MITKIVLVIAIVMPGQQPDITDRLEMPTIESCWDAARDWVAQQPAPHVEGSIGLAGTCFVEIEGDDP